MALPAKISRVNIALTHVRSGISDLSSVVESLVLLPSSVAHSTLSHLLGVASYISEIRGLLTDDSGSI